MASAQRQSRQSRDRQIRDLTDVAMKKLSPAHAREPSADQTRRQRCDQPQLGAYTSEDVHCERSKDPDEYVS